jgi:hypothetical protein
MKNKLLLLILFGIISLQSRGQFLQFNNDSTYKIYNTSDLTLINQEKLSGYDFQLRLYFGSGPTIISKLYLLLITNKKGIWSAEKYIFTRNGIRGKVEVDSGVVQIDNYSALFAALNADSLQSITSMDDMQITQMVKQRKIDADKGIMLVADGTGYKVELLSPNAKRGFSFHCPKSYADFYQLPELKRVVAVLHLLMGLIQMGDPC